nr:MAG TPA: hypothetical protein [Caudoviricetes sp.]
MEKYDNSKLVRIPYLKKTDVGRITGYRRKDLNALFDAAQEIDKQELGINFMFSYKVRTKTVARLIGYTLKELMNMYPEQKKNAPSVESQSAK